MSLASPEASEAPHMKLGIDIDDVVLNSAPLVIDMYNEWHGTKLVLGNWYTAEKNLAPWGVDVAQHAYDKVNEIIGSDEYFERVEAIEGIVEAIDEAGDADAVTGRPERLKAATYRALARHVPGRFSRDNIDFTDFGGANHVDKVVIAHREGFTNFFEDLPRHANDLVKGGVRTVLFGKNPWTLPGVYFGEIREIHPHLITAGDMDAVREFIADEKAALAELEPGEKLPIDYGRRRY